MPGVKEWKRFKSKWYITSSFGVSGPGITLFSSMSYVGVQFKLCGASEDVDEVRG